MSVFPQVYERRHGSILAFSRKYMSVSMKVCQRALFPISQRDGSLALPQACRHGPCPEFPCVLRVLPWERRGKDNTSFKNVGGKWRELPYLARKSLFHFQFLRPGGAGYPYSTILYPLIGIYVCTYKKGTHPRAALDGASPLFHHLLLLLFFHFYPSKMMRFSRFCGLWYFFLKIPPTI